MNINMKEFDLTCVELITNKSGKALVLTERVMPERWQAVTLTINFETFDQLAHIVKDDKVLGEAIGG
jgi:hypothetical protein